MSKIDRREFFLTAVPLSAAGALSLASVAEAQNKSAFQIVSPDAENVLPLNEEILLRVISKTQYPKFLRIEYKVDGKLLGTSTQYPYLFAWTPRRLGAHVLEADIYRGNVKIASVVTSAHVLLYDTLRASSNRSFNVEQSTPSFGMADMTTGIYGFPTNYVGTVAEQVFIKRIDTLLCATTGHKTVENLPFPTNFHYVKARLWNTGYEGFRLSPRNGNVSNTELGAPNLGSTTTPFVTNSAGIKFYLTGWSGLNISLPTLVSLVLSIQFSHVSPNDDREFIRFAHSHLPGQSMRYATGYYTNLGVNFFNLGVPLALRIWVN
jgi:hypothetical protein